jgi:hypothetical protein
VLLLTIIYTINLSVVRPRSCRVIYYFDTPALGRRHQSFGRVRSAESCASPSSDFTSTLWKTESGISCKNFRATQWSDQNLWPFRIITLVSSEEFSASSSSDSTSTPRKTAFRNSSKNLEAIQQLDQKL